MDEAQALNALSMAPAEGHRPCVMCNGGRPTALECAGLSVGEERHGREGVEEGLGGHADGDDGGGGNHGRHGRPWPK